MWPDWSAVGVSSESSRNSARRPSTPERCLDQTRMRHEAANMHTQRAISQCVALAPPALLVRPPPTAPLAHEPDRSTLP